ncbi:MAG: hypothetical protein KDD11_20445 [Acidobacteria bacterium]|nr:hypothetical protein [Acidobacteriota bacterium]
MKRRIAGPLPLFGAFAHTEAGRLSLDPERFRRWLAAWEGDLRSSDWWLDRDAGVLLLRPEGRLTAPQAEARLTVRGAVRLTAPPPEPPPPWTVPAAGGGATALLAPLLEDDEATLEALRGPYALAVWDGRRRRLLLARDPLGQRALFWRRSEGVTVFCSELEPLLRAPGVSCELDAESAFWYLAFGMPPPGKTLARNVHPLPAGHALVWRPGTTPRIERRWTPLSEEAPREATPEVVEELRAKLDGALLAGIDPARTTGILLSGGVDSSYLAACATAHGARPAVALTGDFEERYGLNETPYAAAVAGWLEIPHRTVVLEAAEALELLDEVVLGAAAPCAAWAALTHYQILAEARRLGVDHLVSGLGADEVFGGYDHFRGYYARFLRHRRRRPAPAGIGGFEALLLPEDQESRRVLYPGVARFFDDPSLRRGLGEPYRRWHYASHLRAFYRECLTLKPDAQPIELMIAHECRHRIPEILFAGFEPLSRSSGVAVSYPFLDPDLVRAVCGLRAEDRYRTPGGRFSLRLRDLQPRFKHAMLEVARGRLPPEILERPRKSFTAPFGGWLFEPSFGRPVVDALRRSRFWQRGIVEPAWLDHVLERIVPGPGPWVFELWALVTLAGWYDRYVEPPD